MAGTKIALSQLDFRSMRQMSGVYHIRLEVHVYKATETRKPASEHPRLPLRVLYRWHTLVLVQFACAVVNRVQRLPHSFLLFPWLADNH